MVMKKAKGGGWELGACTYEARREGAIFSFAFLLETLGEAWVAAGRFVWMGGLR